LSNGGVYSGVALTTLTITAATADLNAYQYEAIFTNGIGSATSIPAALTVASATLVPTFAQWSSASDGDWNSASNWSDTQGAGLPGFSGVNGDQAALNGAAELDVDLGGSSPSIAGLSFGPGALDNTIESSGGVLQLNNGGSDATIAVSAGSQTISAPVELASDTAIEVTGSAALNVAGAMFGDAGRSLTVGDAAHNGTLAEGPSGSVFVAGATNVATGSLQVDGTWTTAALNLTAVGGGQGSSQLSGSGTIDLTSGDGLCYNSTAASSFAGRLLGSSSNARLELDGGSLTLSGANSYMGGTTVTVGTLSLANSSAIPTGTSLTVGEGASLVFNRSFPTPPNDTAAAPSEKSARTSSGTSGITAVPAAMSVALASGNIKLLGTVSVAVGSAMPLVQSPAAVESRLIALPLSPLRHLVNHNLNTGKTQLPVVPSAVFQGQNVVRRDFAPGLLASLQPVPATDSDSSDPQRKKDPAMLALDTVFAWYGQ
jgi:autotransporter-associated beta strand protein